MDIRKEFEINVSAQRTWDIIGNQFAQVGDWASSVYASQAQPTSQSSIPSGRVCQTSMGPFTETITHYDEQQKQLAYTAKGEKMPFFVKQLVNRWTVTSLGDNRSRVNMHLTVRILPGFSLVMGPMMRAQMGGVVSKIAEELTYFAEQGEPHPRKGQTQTHREIKMA